MLKLGARLVLMLFILSFGLVNSHGYSFPAKPFQIATSSSHLCQQLVQASQKDAFETRHACEQTKLTPPVEDGSHYHDSESSLQASTFRRILSNEQDGSSDIEPVYHLLIDFSPPSLLASLLATTPMLDLKQHWTSIVSSPPSRLSGWKEGNIQYSHFREFLS